MPHKRVNQYPNGSELILVLKVKDCHSAESSLIKYLDSRFEKAFYDGKQIGREYYNVSEEDIIKSIFKCITSLDK